MDWDIHHGQATQQMFYNDPRFVIYIHVLEWISECPNETPFAERKFRL